MNESIKLGDGYWAFKENALLAYNDENNNFKPIDLNSTRASAATRVNKLGLIESVNTGVPRVDYLNNPKGSLLVEPQSTNLLLRSEEFDNVAWSKINATVTTNTIVSPDGTQNADKFVENNGTGTKWIYNAPTVISGSVYTYSVFAKKGERDFIYINAFSSGNSRAWFNLNTGTIGTTDVGASAKIENYGNGWYRCSVTFTAVSGTNFYLLGVSNANNVENYTGDGTSGIYIWGAQNELGSNATSYIPTVASTVTRVADVISKTGISSLIGQTEGTLYVDFNSKFNVSLGAIFTISDGTSNNRFLLTYNNIGLVQLYFTSNGNSFVRNITTILNNTRYKLAFNYINGVYNIYLNGQNINFTSIADNVPLNLNKLDLGSQNTSFVNNIFINKFVNYKTRLSNAESIELTTL
jgi:hypothetical protein